MATHYSKLKISKLFREGALALTLAIGTGTIALASVQDPTLGTTVSQLSVPLGQSRILMFNDAIENISLGDPNVADVLVLESRKIYVVGKSLGSTNVVVWGKGLARDQYTTFKVEVTHDLDSLKKTLHELMPGEKPEVRSVQGAIILTGEVSSTAKVNAIERLAKQFVRNARKFSSADKKEKSGLGQSMNINLNQSTAKGQGELTSQSDDSGDVVNLIQVGGPSQVMLEVKVAEISRTVLRQMGINLAGMRDGKPWKIGAVNGGASFPNALVKPGDMEVPVFPQTGGWTSGQTSLIGPPVDVFQPTLPAIANAGLFASFLKGASYFNIVVDAAKEDGLAKILAEPTLTTLSGEAASFLSGGEFPIPVWTGEADRIAVTFKEFGISMKALPLVLDSNRINLSLDITVSELSDAAAITSGVPLSNVAYSIPSLATRSANSTVELLDGQTIGIAGLISDRMREAVNKFPGLGDIPVLGALFRSQEFVQDQTELVMFVTARLAKPISPHDIRLPTDNFVMPSDAEFFLLGRMQSHSRPELKDKAVDTQSAPATNVAEEALVLPGLVQQPAENGAPSFGHEL